MESTALERLHARRKKLDDLKESMKLDDLKESMKQQRTLVPLVPTTVPVVVPVLVQHYNTLSRAEREAAAREKLKAHMNSTERVRPVPAAVPAAVQAIVPVPAAVPRAVQAIVPAAGHQAGQLIVPAARLTIGCCQLVVPVVMCLVAVLMSFMTFATPFIVAFTNTIGTTSAIEIGAKMVHLTFWSTLWTTVTNRNTVIPEVPISRNSKYISWCELVLSRDSKYTSWCEWSVGSASSDALGDAQKKAKDNPVELACC